MLPGYPVKALAILPAQAVVTVAGKGMVGVHGIAARTFAAVDAERLSVSTIFQASSESSIGFTVPASEADRAVRGVGHAFRHEIDSGLIDGVSVRRGMSVIAVVGEGMAGTPGIAARVFSALEGGGINIVAIAQGSSERNISFVVSSEQATDAARRVHAAFQLSKIGGGRARAVPHTDVVLLGFGRVGRALADQVAALDGARRVRIVGLLDRSGYVFDARGLSRSRLLRLARQKDAGALLADLGGTRASAREALDLMASHAVSRPVVVDVTSEQTGDLLRIAATAGFDLVLANKKPLAVPWDEYARLMAAVTGASRHLRYEATVGAGLPIIDTFAKLDETGDRVLRIDGCVSGTLMFVLSQVSAGRPFSEAVREAVVRGYAEPDPREDLSGQDVGRKGLILARLLGYRGAAPAPDDLVPASMKSLTLEAFMSQLPSLDASWLQRSQREAARGRVLRYVVSATARGITAKLVAVPAIEPDGRRDRHAQHHQLRVTALSRRTDRHQRSRRGRRRHRGGHPERHLCVVGALAPHRGDALEVATGIDVIRVEPQRAGELALRFGKAPRLRECDAEIVVRIGGSRPKRHGRLERSQRLGKAPRANQRAAQIRIGLGDSPAPPEWSARAWRWPRRPGRGDRASTPRLFIARA